MINSKIEYKKFGGTKEPTFSIIIPTWNNLALLKLCISAVRKNSTHKHQIVVHVNENQDFTKEWLEQEKIDFSFSNENVGVCSAVNSAFSLCDSDLILYLNDDMYVCPEWDKYLLQEVVTQQDNYFYISATLIEPRDSGNNCVLAPYDFGRDNLNFREDELLEKYDKIEKFDWNGASWPPSLMHRTLWNLVGGFSLEFYPGIGSDPDLSMKLWQVGVRYFKGVGKSRVYHFMSKSTGKVKRNNGRIQFLRKWRMASSTFYKFYLKLGTGFTGKLDEPADNLKFKLRKIRDKLKLLIRG